MRLETKGNTKVNSVLGDNSPNTDTRLNVAGKDFSGQIDVSAVPAYSAAHLALGAIAYTGFVAHTAYAMYTKDLAMLHQSWDVTLGAIAILVVLAGGRKLARALANILHPSIVKIFQGVP